MTTSLMKLAVGERNVATNLGINYRLCQRILFLYLKCCNEMTFAATRLEHSLTDVSRWMSANRLKLNSEKTELVWVGSKYGHTPLGSGGPSLQLGTDTVISGCAN